MLQVLRSWIERYLSDEEALLFALLLALAIVVILTMGHLLAPLLTGLVLAFVMQGLINFLARCRVPRNIALSLTFLMFLGVFFGFFLLVIPRVWRQMVNLFNELPRILDRGLELLAYIPANFPNLVTEEKLTSWIALLSDDMAQVGQWIFSYSLSQVPALLSLVVYTILVPFLVFFFLKDKDLLLDWFFSFLPKDSTLMNQIGREMEEQMANYVRGKMIEIIITGGATFILFKILGLNYAALLGFLVGLSVIIPYLGVAVVSVPVVLIAYVQWGWGEDFVYVMLGYTIVQLLDGMILVPLLFSEAVNLHPIAIIAAVLVFGGLWGLWGVFFAIPLATLIKAIMRAWPKHGQVAPALEETAPEALEEVRNSYRTEHQGVEIPE